MALLQLHDIGKIYVSGNTVAVGIRGVNLSFDIGEFVAITGKSGSGKTTLLNVLSGMDTYEEGELYVEGKPTSHYNQSDWEEYRQKYISFIFQDYNIIESFTVLQNVELALMHIPSRKARRARALELIERVGLTSFRHHKGSKLSGGQKQRTVIARALAKDSPIILADEPTGNLDSQSAKEVIELLREISREKLVVIVTHSFDQVAEHATREIRVFDGKVEQDRVLRSATPKQVPPAPPTPSSLLYHLRKGFELGAHRLFATPKLCFFLCFVMILSVIGSFFITSSLVTDLDAFQESYIFQPIDGRLVLTRQDGAPLTDAQLQAAAQKTGASSYLYYDSLLDTPQTLSYYHSESNRFYDATFYFDYGNPFTPDVGRLPQSDNEALLYLPLSWQRVYGKDTLKKTDLQLYEGFCLNVCGVQYYKDNTKDAKIHLTPEGYAAMSTQLYFFQSSQKDNIQMDFSYSIDLEQYKPGGITSFHEVRLDSSLEGNQCYFYSYFYQDVLGSTNHQPIAPGSFTANLNIRFENGSHQSTVKDLVVDWEKCSEYAPSSDNNDEYRYDDGYGGWGGGDHILFVSSEVLEQLMQPRKQAYTQGSLFFAEDAAAQAAIPTLRQEGYLAVLSSVTYTGLETQILKVVMAILMIALWALLILFLVFFLVLCSSRAMMSQRSDLGILRSMGVPNRVIRISTYAQALYALLPALVLLLLCATLIYATPATNAMFPYLHAPQYIILVVTSILVALRIAKKYNQKMFADSVRKTLKGGNHT